MWLSTQFISLYICICYELKIIILFCYLQYISQVSSEGNKLEIYIWIAKLQMYIPKMYTCI